MEYLPKRQYILPLCLLQLHLNQCADNQIVFRWFSIFWFLSSSSRTRVSAVWSLGDNAATNHHHHHGQCHQERRGCVILNCWFGYSSQHLGPYSGVPLILWYHLWVPWEVQRGNITRIANAVQVTLWLLYSALLCSTLLYSVLLCSTLLYSALNLNRCLCSHCSQCLLVSTSVY